MVAKVYAMHIHQSYDYHHLNIPQNKNTDYYMTDEGIDWFFTVLESKPFDLLRGLFSIRFTNIKEGDDLRTAPGFGNIKGISGVVPKAGSKQKAMLIHKVKRCERKYYFDSLVEAREEVKRLLKYYPPEEFKLYRICEDKYKDRVHHVRREVKLILDLSNRGVEMRRQNDINRSVQHK